MSYSSTVAQSGPPPEVTQRFSRVSSTRPRRMPFSKEVTDVRSVVKRAIRGSLRPLLERGHELLVTLPDEPLPINIDPAKLESVVMHLLDNSIKYTPDGGCIWVQLTRENECAVLRVRDSGNGIPADLIKCIFDFVAPAGLAALKTGFGIGLAIAKGLVELDDGSISAHSDGMGRGADFTVRLPGLRNETALAGTVQQ